MRRPRLLAAAVVVVLVLAAGAFVEAVRYGAAAVEAGGGYEQSIAATGRPVWIGFDLRNTSALPVTLHGFTPRGLENLRVLDARVVSTERGGFSMLTEPLQFGLQDVLDASKPVEGFVLPPEPRPGGSEVVVQVQRVTAGHRAVLHGGAVTYSVLGFDQGAIDDGVSCIRAPGRRGC